MGRMIGAQLEWNAAGRLSTFALDQPRCTVGKGAADLVIPERTVSRLHAAIEQVTGGWVIQDLGSRNGTFINGVRVMTPRALRSGDEIRFGSFVATFRSAPVDPSVSMTAPLQGAPGLTRREHDALVALCRPILTGSMLEEPATVADIATELTVSESAAKKLLSRMYSKFDLFDSDRRRGRLAVEALRRGAVSVADLEADGGHDARSVSRSGSIRRRSP